ncbi:putative DNA binding domain-containing protein [Anabaena sphaerica FACHB-251]|uniref:DNA binding domain-containing protein n=1 Tax=Anabaena sphaerica FACHB-251 TaxID=2692883 RepID=A0A926WEM2_9NOST|nr:ATP-binding protein [Anabaena sphaerica]MBD2292742.1 putative DNA binding domain-containing protein [Anabaena sphaerica FACHB-251]
MAIEVVPITSDQLNQILIAEESHFLDLKAIDVQPRKLCKFISGFANADGGELFIGIDESIVDDKKIRHWHGFSDQEAANGHLQIFEYLFPLGDDCSYTFLTSEGYPGLVLQVTIFKSRRIVEASDGIPYLRRGAQTLPVKGDKALERLKLDKGIESFERSTIGVELELITTSQVMSTFINAVVPTTEAELWLKKQQLIQKDKPTIGGILLFADEPQAILPKHCGVKIYRYRTKDVEGTRETLAFDPITIEGCLYDQIQQALAKTIEIVEEIPKVGDKGLESIKYPEEAIHEILTNALLHRDYSIASDTHIRIFDNRIEIENPGKLPGHITVKNILKEQYARNGAIVRIINKFPNPPNKDVGEGLNTAFHAMARLRLQPPEICEQENSVAVHIKHEPLASLETTIMSYLEKHKEITNKIARKETGIRSEGTIKAAFYRLRDSRLIEPVPGRSKSNAAWRKVGTIDTDPEDTTSIYENYPEYELLVMNYLDTHSEITNREARELTGVESGTVIKNIFYRLRKKGLIEIVPGKSRIHASWRKVLK